MNANQATNRYTELNAVLDQARRQAGSPTLITEDQLLGLQHRWSTFLSARLDQAIEAAGPEPLVEAVAGAWRRLAADQPTLRAVLDAGEQRCAALTEAMEREYWMLAVAAGIANLDDPTDEAARLGRRYRNLITSSPTTDAPDLHQVA